MRYVIYHSPAEFWSDYDMVAKRKAALAKLTEEDRKALGLE